MVAQGVPVAPAQFKGRHCHMPYCTPTKQLQIYYSRLLNPKRDIANTPHCTSAKKHACATAGCLIQRVMLATCSLHTCQAATHAQLQAAHMLKATSAAACLSAWCAPSPACNVHDGGKVAVHVGEAAQAGWHNRTSWCLITALACSACGTVHTIMNNHSGPSVQLQSATAAVWHSQHRSVNTVGCVLGLHTTLVACNQHT